MGALWLPRLMYHLSVISIENRKIARKMRPVRGRTEGEMFKFRKQTELILQCHQFEYISPGTDRSFPYQSVLRAFKPSCPVEIGKSPWKMSRMSRFLPSPDNSSAKSGRDRVNGAVRDRSFSSCAH